VPQPTTLQRVPLISSVNKVSAFRGRKITKNASVNYVRAGNRQKWKEPSVQSNNGINTDSEAKEALGGRRKKWRDQVCIASERGVLVVPKFCEEEENWSTISHCLGKYSMEHLRE
jgi:hypothetical protein